MDNPNDELRQRLEDRGITTADAARHMGVPHNRLSRILTGQHRISLDMAYRIAFYFNEAVQPWYFGQARHDMNQYEAMYAEEVRKQVIPWNQEVE